MITVVNCGDPEQVDHVNSTVDDTVYGSTVIHECVEGYNYTTVVDLIRTCQADGIWSGKPPQCNSKHP